MKNPWLTAILSKRTLLSTLAPKVQLSGTSVLVTLPDLATLKLTLLGVLSIDEVPDELRDDLSAIVQKLGNLIRTCMVSGRTKELIAMLDLVASTLASAANKQPPLDELLLAATEP